MSIRLMSAVWELKCESHTQKLVLLALADNASDQGKCWPSIPTIARKCQLTERCVYLQIDRLVEREQVERKSGGGHSSNHYLLKITPEYGSGVNTVQGCTPFRAGVNTVQGSPERHSGEPSVNRQETVKGEKNPPTKYIREIRIQIEEAEQERTSLKNKHASITSTGTSWDSEPARKEFIELGRKIKEWRHEIFSK